MDIAYNTSYDKIEPDVTCNNMLHMQSPNMKFDIEIFCHDRDWKFYCCQWPFFKPSDWYLFCYNDLSTTTCLFPWRHSNDTELWNQQKRFSRCIKINRLGRSWHGKHDKNFYCAMSFCSNSPCRSGDILSLFVIECDTKTESERCTPWCSITIMVGQRN